MDDHAARPRPYEALQLENEAATRHLRRLAAAYPDFSFHYATLGRKGKRWWAERIDRTGDGLIVVITDDLLEMHAALRKDKENRHAQ